MTLTLTPADPNPDSGRAKLVYLQSVWAIYVQAPELQVFDGTPWRSVAFRPAEWYQVYPNTTKLSAVPDEGSLQAC